MARQPGNAYQWLRRIKRYWVTRLDLLSPALLVLFVVFGVVARLIGLHGRGVVAVALAFLGGSFVAAMLHFFLLYNVVRCPSCGHNPTRYKNGKNIPMKTVYKKLAELSACASCGR